MEEAVKYGWDWVGTLQRTLFEYRCTPHSTTGISPFESMFRRRMRDKLALFGPRVGNGEVRDRSRPDEKGTGKDEEAT